MAKGHENLIPTSMRSKEEVRAIASKGGKKSGETRRFKKTFREALEQILDDDPELRPKLMRVALSEAFDGNNKIKALEFLRDMVGEKPSDKVEVEGDATLNVTINVRKPEE